MCVSQENIVNISETASFITVFRISRLPILKLRSPIDSPWNFTTSSTFIWIRPKCLIRWFVLTPATYFPSSRYAAEVTSSYSAMNRVWKNETEVQLLNPSHVWPILNITYLGQIFSMMFHTFLGASNTSSSVDTMSSKRGRGNRRRRRKFGLWKWRS